MKRVLILLCCLIDVVFPATNVIVNQCPQSSDVQVDGVPFRYSHPDNCVSFFTCVIGIPYLQNCSPGKRWSDEAQMCVDEGSEFDNCTKGPSFTFGNPECEPGSTEIFPHPTACQRYFNCSDTSPRNSDSLLADFENECLYPQLFDSTEKLCKPYDEVNCGCARTEFKDPCEYLQNLPDGCTELNCDECRAQFPTCIGKEDGNFEFPGQLWSPFFIVCQDERLIERGARCPQHGPTRTVGFFSPINRTCVSIFEVPTSFGLLPSCDGLDAGFYDVPLQTNTYYRCPGPEVLYCEFGVPFDFDKEECSSSV